MRAAIIGLPQSGKSTLFTAATGQKREPGGPPQEHIGVVRVPDPRVDFLAALYKPKKITFASIEFVDVPGFSLADRHGLDELKRHMPTVRESDLLVAVIRDFANPAAPPYRNRVDPSADLSELWEEMVYADLEMVTNRLDRLEKSLKKPSKTHDAEKREQAQMERCKQALEGSRPISSAVTHEDEKKAISNFGFLTEKSWIVVYNVGEDRAAQTSVQTPAHAHSAVALCAETEAQIAELEESDRPVFLADLGIAVPAKDRLVQSCYGALGLISFLTVGEDEVRAWTIKKGTQAVDAAGKIHSDLARGFIRAETVAYDDLRAAGDMRGAKAAGRVRQEGKTYVVQDGDIINVKFNL